MVKKTRIQMLLLVFVLVMIAGLGFYQADVSHAGLKEIKPKTEQEKGTNAAKKEAGKSKEKQTAKKEKEARSGQELANRANPLDTKGLSDEEIQNLGNYMWSDAKKIDPALKVTMKNDKGVAVNIVFEKVISAFSNGTYDFFTNHGGYTASKNGTTINGTGFARITIDGVLAYCVQPGVTFIKGQGYSAQTSVGYISAAQTERINKVVNFGGKAGDSDAWYAATQALVWEGAGWNISIASALSSEKSTINDRIANFDTVPSVANQAMTIKEGKTGGSITDTKGVLKHYRLISNTTKATIDHNGNTLTGTLPIGADDNGEIAFVRDGTGSGTLYFWVKDDSQTVVTAGTVPEKIIKVKIKRAPLSPEIGTTATDKETGGKAPSPEKQITIVDTVKYKDLTPGKEYVMKGTLMDKATNLPLEVNGQKVTSEVTFTPDDESGTVKLEFTFEALALANKEVVVFESLFSEGKEVAVHTDINDKDQTVKFRNPEIGTTAKDKETDTKTPAPEKDITLVDTVAYSDLIPGKEYIMKGILMDKETNSPLLADGNEIRAEKTFTPQSASGTVDLEFAFDANLLANKEVVVFEDLYRNGNLVISHADIEDQDQTVKFTDPKIKTTATDKNSGTKEPDADDQITIIDVVKYTDLIPGKEYTMKGTLMSKKTGKPLLVNGKEVRAEKVFTPADKDGTVELEFTFDASALVGQELVVFEDLYRRGNLVVSHADIEDKDQTVEVKTPEIRTTATDKKTGTHKPAPDKTVTIVDKIKYKDLIPNRQYTVRGVLMNKQTGKPLLVNGREVRAEKTFTPKTRNGYVLLAFTFDGSALAGREVVVFENLYRRNIIVASHADLNDGAQTVKFKGIPVVPRSPRTGDDSNLLLFSMATALSLGTLFVVARRKKALTGGL